MWDPYAEFETATLPNGLRIYAAHWPNRPWEVMGFLIHSGAEHDPVGLEGLAHFVEHLVSENAGVSEKELEGFFKDSGGSVNLGAMGYPYAYYRFFIPKEKDKVHQALDMFGTMLLSAKLERLIERERQVIIGEFHRAYPTKYDLDIALRMQQVLYADSWLGRFIRPFGLPESIERITQSDLQTYYDTHYTPANMSIVGVGGLDIQELSALISDSPFAMSKPGVRTSLPKKEEEVTPLSESRYVFKMSEHVTMTNPLEVAHYRSFARIPGVIETPSIKILARMMDEILFEEVREQRAWAYHIETVSHYFQQFRELSIQCNGLVPEALGEIEGVVTDIIGSMEHREALFGQAKQRILADLTMVDLTARGLCDGALDDLIDHQRIISYREFARNVERTTMKDVREALEWLKPEYRWTLLIQP